MFLPRLRPESLGPQLQVFILVSHSVPRPLCLAIPLPLWAAGGRHASAGASVGDSADVRKQAPPTQPGFQFHQAANTIMQIIFLAHMSPTPWQSYIFILPSEANVHRRPAKYLHPIYFKMSGCHSDTGFSFQEGDCEYRVMN